MRKGYSSGRHTATGNGHSFDLAHTQVVNVIRSLQYSPSMIIKSDSAPTQDIQDIQPPPEYTPAPVRPEPTPPQLPAPVAQTQYPPRPPTHNRDNLPPQQHQAQIGQEYRNRRRPLSSYSPDSPSSQNWRTELAHCARGDHDATTTFGICGIVCSIVLFPIGLVCLW